MFCVRAQWRAAGPQGRQPLRSYRTRQPHCTLHECRGILAAINRSASWPSNRVKYSCCLLSLSIQALVILLGGSLFTQTSQLHIDLLKILYFQCGNHSPGTKLAAAPSSRVGRKAFSSSWSKMLAQLSNLDRTVLPLP